MGCPAAPLAPIVELLDDTPPKSPNKSEKSDAGFLAADVAAFDGAVPLLDDAEAYEAVCGCMTGREACIGAKLDIMDELEAAAEVVTGEGEAAGGAGAIVGRAG